MSDRPQRLSLGYKIQGYPAKTHPVASPASVRIWDLIGNGVDYTPDEALSFAEAIRAEAMHAKEGK